MIIKAFKENKDVFDTLVEKIYVRDEQIQINFSEQNIQFLVNGQEEKLGEEDYNLLNKLYSILKCKSANLHKHPSGDNELSISWGRIENYYEVIYYTKNNEEAFNDELPPGWDYIVSVLSR